MWSCNSDHITWTFKALHFTYRIAYLRHVPHFAENFIISFSLFSQDNAIEWLQRNQCRLRPFGTKPGVRHSGWGLGRELMLSGRPRLTGNPLRQKTEHSRCFCLLPNKLLTSYPLPARLVWIGRGGWLCLSPLGSKQAEVPLWARSSTGGGGVVKADN